MTIRAPGQHACFIERRGASLRESIRKSDTRWNHKQICDIPYPRHQCEAVIAGNALMSVSETTSDQVLCGRVPKLSFDVEALTLDATDLNPGAICHSHSLSKIAVQSVVKSTSRVRSQQAFKVQTLFAAQTTSQQGDQTDL